MSLRVKLQNYLEEAQTILISLLLFVFSHPRETGQFSHGGPKGIEFMLLLLSWQGHRTNLTFKTLSASIYSGASLIKRSLGCVVTRE